MRMLRQIGLIIFASIFILSGSLKAVSPKQGLFDNRGYCAKTATWMPLAQAGGDEPELLQAPVVGSRNIIVLLVEFSDHRAKKTSHSPAAFQKLLFDSTGAVSTGSMYDYYQEVSYGRFFINGDVSVWLEAPQTNSYYTDGQYGKGNWPRNRIRLAYDVVVATDPFIDFSQYDNDKDSVVDALFIVHAGPGGEETGDTKDLWSHKGTLPANANGTGRGYMTDDGVTIVAYTMQPEEHEDERLISIGVFCHEYGHVLGLPDLYDRDNSSEGIGTWCVMASGSWGGDGRSPETPVHFCAWSKEKLGWVDPVIIKQNLNSQFINRAEDHPEVFKLWTNGLPNTEYFLVENRQRVGFDSNLPNDGLLIWHIDNSVATQNDDEDHKLVDLEAADGNEDMDRGSNRGDAGDSFPGYTLNRFFDFFSQPSSSKYNGDPSQVSVLNISDSQTTMTADLEIIAEHPILRLEDHMVIDDQGNSNEKADPGEEVELVVTLKNYGREATHVNGLLTTSDPTIHLLVDSAPFSDMPIFSVGHNQHTPFVFSADPSAVVHYAYFTLMVWSEGDDDSTHISFRLVIGHPAVLLVDDDYDQGTSEWVFDVEAFYQAALDSTGEVHDYWSWKDKGTPGSDLLKTYDVVIWFTGHAEPPLTSEDIDNMISFLNGGGGLFIAGQDVGFGLQSSPFLHNYLHAQWLEDDSNEGFVTGVPEDPLSGDIQGFLVLSGADAANNQPSPDVIAPLGGATPVFHYSPSGRTAAVKYAGDYRVVYFAFGFEALSGFGPDSKTIRTNLMAKIVEWLKGQSTEINPVDCEISTPLTYALTQNYPNPFNLSTTIQYTLTGGERRTEDRRQEPIHTTLKLYNILGQKVRTLVDAVQEPGYFTVTWDGKNALGNDVASGIYFYRLKAGTFTAARRMMLMK